MTIAIITSHSVQIQRLRNVLYATIILKENTEGGTVLDLPLPAGDMAPESRATAVVMSLMTVSGISSLIVKRMQMLTDLQQGW